MADEQTGIVGDVSDTQADSGKAVETDGGSGADSSRPSTDAAGGASDSANGADAAGADHSDADKAAAGKEDNQEGGATQEADDKKDESVADEDPDNSPISDWESVDLGLSEEDAVDQDVLASFGKAAVDLGLTPKQAKALARWQLDAIAEARTALMETGAEELRKDWGRKSEANQQKVLSLIANIDRKIGNEAFSKALGASGATCHAGVIKGLYAIASMLSEDAMGAGKASAMPDKPETALEGIENAFREMKQRM